MRIVEDVVIEKQGKRPEVQGTKVRSDVLEVNNDTLFPLQGALGYEVTQSLFIGANTWLVEGPSDILYLQVVSQALAKRRRTALDPKWTLCPSGGIDKIAPFVRLFGGNRINVAVLSDIANGDKTKIENLKKADILKAGHFYTCSDFTNQSESDVEDLFDIDLFVEMLNGAYNPPVTNVVTKEALMAAAPTARIVKKLRPYSNSCLQRSQSLTTSVRRVGSWRTLLYWMRIRPQFKRPLTVLKRFLRPSMHLWPVNEGLSLNVGIHTDLHILGSAL
ncbi:hypothetical protein [Ottowia beijingensis]|uniref:hypothetical protein n=1 Tax=Ottowia beijingensis TaxID=1207057 RepID=UPI00214DB624|nr:hypothetical protein [Ottowia beijingensis]